MKARETGRKICELHRKNGVDERDSGNPNPRKGLGFWELRVGTTTQC